MPTQILQPDTVGSHEDQWGLVAGANKVVATDPGDPIVHDDATTHINANLKGKKQSFKFESFTTAVPSAKTVVSVQYNIRLRTTDIPTPTFIRVWSTNSVPEVGAFFDIPIAIGSIGWTDYAGTLPPADGGDWTLAKADDAEIRFLLDGSTAGGDVDCTSVWLVVEYADAITAVIPADETARRLLRRFRFPEEPYRLQLGPRGEQIELWKDFRFVDAFGPESTGLGFGPEEWESRLLRCIRKTPDPKTGNVAVEAIDVRRYLTTFFLSGISDAPGKTTGTIRLDQGVVETFARASKAWVEWSDGRVYEIASGEKQHNHLGLLIEKKATNRIINSAFHVLGGGGADVFATWVEVLSGAGITADTTERYFNDTAVVARHMKIANTSPVENRGVNETTSFSFLADSWVACSIVHREEGAGEQFELGIQNTVTGNHLQSDGSWSSTAVFKPFTSTQTRKRDTLVFQMESTAGTILFRIRNNTVNAAMHFWQVDFIDDADFATSPILTTTAEVSREESTLKFDNKVGQEVIPFAGQQFTIQMVLKPQFGSADVFAKNQWIYANKGGASLYAALVYETNGFAFRDDTSGIVTASAVDPTFVAGDEIKIVHRRSGSRGEHEFDADEEQIMVKVGAGAWQEGGVVSSVDRTFNPATDQSIFLGYQDFLATATKQQLDGYFVYFDVRPFVLPIEEAKDFP